MNLIVFLIFMILLAVGVFITFLFVYGVLSDEIRERKTKKENEKTWKEVNAMEMEK